MSKRPDLRGYDKDGYMELIPRSTQSTAMMCSSIHEGDDSSTYWKARCEELEKENAKLKEDIDGMLDIMDQQRELLDSVQAEIENAVQIRLLAAGGARETVQHDSHLAQISDPTESSDSDFEWGVGLQFGGGKEPELYRISDKKGPLVQKRKFAGGVVEVQPGRGFRVGLRWKADK